MAVWPTRNGAVAGMKVSTFEKGENLFCCTMTYCITVKIIAILTTKDFDHAMSKRTNSSAAFFQAHYISRKGSF